MVQIMSSGGPGSKNRADRASLDDPATLPINESWSELNNHDKDISTVIPSPEPVVSCKDIPTAEDQNAVDTHLELENLDEIDEEDEDYESSRRREKYFADDSNNNINTDCGLVLDPWAVTSSLIDPPDYYDTNNDDEENAVKSNKDASVTARHKKEPLATLFDTYAKKYSFRRRKSSSISSSSCCSSSSTSLKLKINKKPASLSRIVTRRSSSSSASNSSLRLSRKRMAETETSSTIAVSNDVITSQVTTDNSDQLKSPPLQSPETVPYCYRCFVTFSSHMEWREHAVYEHIMKKNPYPIVEMNYVDPVALQLGLTIEALDNSNSVGYSSEPLSCESVMQNEPTSPTVGIHINIPTNTNGIDDTSSVSPKEQLKLKFSKKGTSGSYTVTASNGNPSGETTSTAENHNNEHENPESISIITQKDMGSNNSILDESITAVEQFPEANSIVNIKKINNNVIDGTTVECNKISSVVFATGLPQQEDKITTASEKDTHYHKKSAIDSEFPIEFNMDEEFERALEIAAEKSRIGVSPDLGTNGVDVDIRQRDNSMIATTGREAGIISTESPESATNTGVEAATASTMISQEVSQPLSVESQNCSKGDSPSPSISQTQDAVQVPSDIGSPELPNCNSPNIENVSVNSASQQGSLQRQISTPGKQSSPEAEENDDESNSASDSHSDSPALKIVDESNTTKNPIVVEETTQKKNTEEGEKSSNKDADDFQCSMCQKICLSDDDLEKHFSDEHIRFAGTTGILEPESPCPSSVRSMCLDDDYLPMTPLTPLNPLALNPGGENTAESNFHLNSLIQQHRRLSADNQASIHHQAFDNNGLANLLVRNSITAANTQNNFNRLGPSQGQGQRPPFVHPSSVINRPMNMNQRVSPPNMIISGVSGHPRPQSNLNQSRPIMHHSQSNPNLSVSRPSVVSINQINLQNARPQFHDSRGQNIQPQRPHVLSQLNQRPSSYPVSLHNALTTTNSPQSQSILRNTSQIQGPGQMHHPRPPPMRPSLPQQSHLQIQSRPLVQQQQQQRAACGPLHAHIQQEQQRLNQMNAERERVLNHLNIQNQMRPQMPRLQQQPQLRLSGPQLRQQQPQSLQPSQYKRTSNTEMEIHEISPNKLPRLENIQRRLPSDVSITNRVQQQPSLDRNVAAAIGSVGCGGVPSVRLGNAITLSVCSSGGNSNEQSHNSPIHSPATITESRLSSGSSSPVVPTQPQSVLALAGVSVTPASPPIRNISPATPSVSPHLVQGQQYSVIQLGPRSGSPVNQTRNQNSDRNFSPPVITTVRGGVGASQPSNNNNNNQPMYQNFAVPRAPAPRIQSQQTAPGQNSPNFSINSIVERPDRPPTVDLTNDDVQTHNNQRMNANSRQMAELQQQLQQRRFIQVNQPSRGIIPSTRCTLCNVAFPSIVALETHKLEFHGMHTMQSGQIQNNNRSGPQPTAVRSTNNPGHGIQIRDIRSMNPNTIHHTAPVRAPPLPQQSQQRGIPQHLVRSTSSPTRPITQSIQPNNSGKYLYIPLLDLSRMDANKIRRLEEIGISAIVPLQEGNSSPSILGIPVMNLRSDAIMTNQHVPWDSVLPMGPLQTPTIRSGNNNNLPPRGNPGVPRPQ